MTAFDFRAIQLDLARQMETVDQVKRFIDFTRGHGYNTLFLYLEGRVRTPSFALPTAESYSLEQIHAMVEHATAAGMDTMLATATLAHGEHFFQLDSLRPLAEERDGRTRFGSQRCETFCPSQEGTYDFWRRYLTELLPVFPSKHLHVGCDEAFNLGYCPLCHARKQKEGLQGLFLQHLQRIHRLCGDLGKRMWIWDDMFELFPAALREIPRDIVLCYWMYDPQVDLEGGRAHFANRRRHDFLADYARLGLDSVFCPASYEIANIEALTRYAARRRPLGGLLTQWEMQQVDLAEYAPTVALAGELWSAPDPDPAAAWSSVTKKLLTGLTVAETAAVRVLCNCTRKNLPPLTTWFTGPLTLAEMNARDAVQVALETLRAKVPAAPPPGPVLDTARVLFDLTLSARQRLLWWELQTLAPEIHDPRRPAVEQPALERRAAAAQAELQALIQAARPLSGLRRPGMFPTGGLHAHLTKLAETLQPLWARLAAPAPADAAWLVLRLALLDFHGVPRVKVELEVAGQWQPVFQGMLKAPDVYGTPFFTARIPCGVKSSSLPTAVRISGAGYGGIGLSFVELHTATQRLRPVSLQAQAGRVEHPTAALIDDSTVSWLGDRDYAAAMLDPAVADRAGTVTLALAVAP